MCVCYFEVYCDLIMNVDCSVLLPILFSTHTHTHTMSHIQVADLANADATEEEKILAAISQSGDGFDPAK